MAEMENASSLDDPHGTLGAAADEDPEAGSGGRFDAHRLQSAAFLAKSLADANRLRILLLISGSRKSVSAIVEALELSQPLVSHHLKELKRSLLVTVEREGPFVYYELADARILEVLRTLGEVATDLLSRRKSF
jgi:DNA-binding transcriptional ArsR family regulator